MPEVNVPVRWDESGEGSAASDAVFSLALHQFQDLDRRVIVVQHRPLRRLPDQLVEAGAAPGLAAATMSHWVEAGSGTPRSPCSFRGG